MVFSNYPWTSGTGTTRTAQAHCCLGAQLLQRRSTVGQSRMAQAWRRPRFRPGADPARRGADPIGVAAPHRREAAPDVAAAPPLLEAATSLHPRPPAMKRFGS